MRIQAISVTDVEFPSVEDELFIAGMNGHTAFLPEIVESPDVMVSGEEVHLDAAVRKFADFCATAYRWPGGLALTSLSA